MGGAGVDDWQLPNTGHLYGTWVITTVGEVSNWENNIPTNTQYAR